MADNEPTISMAGINAPPLYRLVKDGDKTVIVTADTNTPMWVINGKIGGDTVEVMTTAERTAITPEAGQLIYDTDLGVLFVGDGTTAGGTAVGGGGGGGVVPGYRLSDDGTSLNFNPVTPVVDATGSNTVTLNPDHAYKVVATGGAVTLNANVPASGYWGLEGHAEIFVAGTGYIVTGTNVVLAQALEPDSVNNCTVRFHDGMAIISVEDHVAGYIVVNGATSGDGSLYYGISTSTNDYVAFDASLTGTVIPLAGAVAEGEKHLVGNGYTSTTLTGAVNCGTSKFTVANLALQNVAVNGGVMTLGDAFIPSGSTVAVSGGGLAVEKVTGNGGVIDLGGTHVVRILKQPVKVSGCTFTSGVAYANTDNRYGGAFSLNQTTAVFSNCQFIGNNGNISDGRGGGIYAASGNGQEAILSVVNCVFTGNVAYQGNAIYTLVQTTIQDCVFNANQSLYIRDTTATFVGTNVLKSNVAGNGSVTISSGAILDLTGNTNAAPIAPGGGITFASGGATVYPSAGSASAFLVDNAVVAAINNDGGVFIPNSQTTSATFSRAIVSAAPLGSTTVIKAGATMTLLDCGYQGVANNAAAVVLGGTFSLTDSKTAILKNVTSSNTIVIQNGAVLDVHLGAGSGYLGANTLNATEISVADGGTATLVYKSGSTTATKFITGSGTYIERDGTTDLTVVE